MASIGVPSGGTPVTGLTGQVVTVSGNNISGHGTTNMLGQQAISVWASNRAQANVAVIGNGTAGLPVRNIKATGIRVYSQGTNANVYANVSNNYLTPNPSGGTGYGIEGTSGIGPLSTDSPLLTMLVTGNTIGNTFSSGISLSAATAQARISGRVESNTVAAPFDAGSSWHGIEVRSSSSVASNVCVKLLNNSSAGNVTGFGTYPGIGLIRSAASVLGIDGLTPSPAASPTVENFVNARNSSASGTVGVGGTQLLSTTSGYTSCTAP